MKYFEDVYSVDFNAKCDWLPANQFLFQLANLFLVFTYFVQPNSMLGLLQLRFALMMAGLCFGIWGGIIICALDCLVWNVAFAIGNALHLIYLLVKMRPVKFAVDQEFLYERIFQPVGVKRFQYSQLVSISTRRSFKPKEYYATRGVTEISHVGIVISGSFAVQLENSIISHIDRLEFIDSPEWIATNESLTTYQVSLIARSPCEVFVWKKDDLMKLFKKDTMLKNVFDSLIGKDICKKLFSLHQTFLAGENQAVSELLHQAPLLAYSVVSLMELHTSPFNSPRQVTAVSCDVADTPHVTSRQFKPTAFIKNGSATVTNGNNAQRSVSLCEKHEIENETNDVLRHPSLDNKDDFNIHDRNLESHNLILRETNL